jgi:hypothetical protein
MLALGFTYIIAVKCVVGVVWDGNRLSVLARDHVIYLRILCGTKTTQGILRRPVSLFLIISYRTQLAKK